MVPAQKIRAFDIEYNFKTPKDLPAVTRFLIQRLEIPEEPLKSAYLNHVNILENSTGCNVSDATISCTLQKLEKAYSMPLLTAVLKTTLTKRISNIKENNSIKTQLCTSWYTLPYSFKTSSDLQQQVLRELASECGCILSWIAVGYKNTVASSSMVESHQLTAMGRCHFICERFVCLSEFTNPQDFAFQGNLHWTFNKFLSDFASDMLKLNEKRCEAKWKRPDKPLLLTENVELVSAHRAMSADSLLKFIRSHAFNGEFPMDFCNEIGVLRAALSDSKISQSEEIIHKILKATLASLYGVRVKVSLWTLDEIMESSVASCAEIIGPILEEFISYASFNVILVVQLLEAHLKLLIFFSHFGCIDTFSFFLLCAVMIDSLEEHNHREAVMQEFQARFSNYVSMRCTFDGAQYRTIHSALSTCANMIKPVPQISIVHNPPLDKIVSGRKISQGFLFIFNLVVETIIFNRKISPQSFKLLASIESLKTKLTTYLMLSIISFEHGSKNSSIKKEMQETSEVISSFLSRECVIWRTMSESVHSFVRYLSKAIPLYMESFTHALKAGHHSRVSEFDSIVTPSGTFIH